MATTACLGFPRIGAHRELKKALESYWTGASTRDSLLATGRSIRLDGWKRQQSAGITRVACGDFHFYDQVLTHSVTLGCIPARYAAVAAQGDALAVQFAMARGHQHEGIDVIACEMTKWFDTNYHYIVPEFTVDTEFNLLAEPPVVADFKEATSQGFAARPVVLGPVTYLTLGKMKDASSPDDALSVLLPKLLPAYVKLLQQLKAAGAEDVQIDEPVLVLDLTPAQKDAYVTAFTALAAAGQKMTLATYFGWLRDNAELAFSLEGVASVHIDVCREAQLAVAFEHLRPGQSLSLGVVDGRNVWKNDHAQSLLVLRAAVKRLGADRIVVAPSCSLLHTPVDLASEPQLDPEIAQWMAFAQQKLEEVSLLARALNDAASVAAVLDANAAVMSSRRNSTRIHRPAAKARLESVQACDMERQSPFSTRIGEQNRRLQLPLLPTTTIGSFPQTVEVRKARASFKAGSMSSAEYQAFLEKVTAECVRVQEDLGLDVLVHGEFERNDMVEYFGEQLSGFVFTANGWTQSYGSRCVKPPVIFGDVERPVPMTVAWAKYAQAQTRLPMKGMITGPVTILQWSFVRDDQPREITCKQIALAMRDEVLDLEAAGIAIIQIDEAALREGLPLRAADKPAYLRWAVDAFRLTASGVRDDTQIHTHMCYSDFNDIMAAVANMDADVISIETSRSAMKLLDSFVDFKYPNQIGPGVYDIHSPRVPTEAEMVSLLTRALTVLKAEQVWVNPDCGLKTRGWKEVIPALRAVVTTAQQARLQLKA